MVRAHGRRAGISSVQDIEVGRTVNFPNDVDIENGGENVVVTSGVETYLQSAPFSNGKGILYDRWQQEIVAEWRNDRGEFTSVQPLGVQTATTQPGTSGSPALLIGDGGAGFFINATGEVVVVDEAANTTVIS